VRLIARLIPLSVAITGTGYAMQVVFPTSQGEAVALALLFWTGFAATSVAVRLAPPILRVEGADPAARVIDDETGLPNQHQMRKDLAREIARNIRHRRRAVLCVVDVRVVGWIAADPDDYPPSPARHVARGLVNGLRPTDFVWRYDFARFATLLPDCSLVDASRVMDRVLANVAGTPYARAEDGSALTVRCLVTPTEWTSADVDPEAFIRLAIEESGRHRAAMMPPPHRGARLTPGMVAAHPTAARSGWDAGAA
jgi:GGDEF domain-containing protein